jgi:ABC-type dipeptide/oligopeptide/nickel transport system permease subunit
MTFPTQALRKRAAMSTFFGRRWTTQVQEQWAAILAGLVLGVLAVIALLAPLVAPADPLVMTPHRAFEAPSAAYPFGTDEFGRDILSRVIFGTRISVGTAVIVVVMASSIGIPLGLAAGYFGGIVDSLIMRLIDTILAFPAILLAMGLIAVLGQSELNGMIAVIIVSIPTFARLVRANTLQQKGLEYVIAARAMGASDFRIIMRTLLPNCLPPLLPQIAINASFAVLLEASLSFLGLGPKPPTPSWGQMLNSGRIYLYRAPWYGFFPGVFLTSLVLALNILADALQRYLSHGKIR